MHQIWTRSDLYSQLVHGDDITLSKLNDRLGLLKIELFISLGMIDYHGIVLQIYPGVQTEKQPSPPLLCFW